MASLCTSLAAVAHGMKQFESWGSITIASNLDLLHRIWEEQTIEKITAKPLFIFIQIKTEQIISRAQLNQPLMPSHHQSIFCMQDSCYHIVSRANQGKKRIGNPAIAVTAIVSDKKRMLAAARGKMQFQGGWHKLLIIPDLTLATQSSENELSPLRRFS